MKCPTPRQQAILAHIRQFIDEFGYPPTVRQIQSALGISSTSVVDYNLNILERQGHLRRDPETSRGLEVIGESVRELRHLIVGVPILGRIAAGEPIEAIQDAEYVNLTRELVPDEGAFALRVRGQSMIEDHIDDGDLVIVRPQSDASDGDTVVALLMGGPTEAGEVTLKRFYRERERIRLQPANSTMAPIFVNADQLRVQGKVIAVIRKVAGA
jgi:repressor LexA